MARRSAMVMCSAVVFSATGSSTKTVGAELQRGDQGAVDDEVGVAPDRRGEVGVAVEVQAEVSDVVRRIDRLHLGPQHDLVDDLGVRRLAGLVEQAVEAIGARRLALAPRDDERGEEVGQRLQLLRAGRVVDAVDQGGAELLQGLGGADVGLDHELFDQLVRGERRRAA